jgi:hypothetical protein
MSLYSCDYDSLFYYTKLIVQIYIALFVEYLPRKEGRKKRGKPKKKRRERERENKNQQ